MTATDLNQPMLDHAKARQPADSRIEWRQADALALPFEDRSFDAVACQFGVMFFPDKVQGYKEARRVLKPGGHFFFNVWDRIRRKRFCRHRHASAGGGISAGPAALPRPHAARLSRREANSRGTEGGGICECFSRCRGCAKQGCRRRAILRLPIARGLRCGMKSRRAMRRAWKRRRTQAADAMARRFGTGAVDGRIRAFVISAS